MEKAILRVKKAIDRLNYLPVELITEVDLLIKIYDIFAGDIESIRLKDFVFDR